MPSVSHNNLLAQVCNRCQVVCACNFTPSKKKQVPWMSILIVILDVEMEWEINLLSLQ
jgi:hypothetical protein